MRITILQILKMRNKVTCLIISLFALLVTIQPCFASDFAEGNQDKENKIEGGNNPIRYHEFAGGDTSEVRRKLEIDLSYSKAHSSWKGIITNASMLGEYYLNQFNLKKAEKYYRESFDASKKEGDKANQANSANNLGTIAEKIGNYGEAVSYYLQAYEIFDSLNNKIGISGTANNLGIIYYLINESEKALGFLKLAANLKRDLKDSISLVITYQNLGNVYFELWNYDSASYYYQKCLELSDLIDDNTSVGKAANSLGVIAMMENNYGKASELFSISIDESGKGNDFQNISSTYDNLGLLNQNSGKPDIAFIYFDSSLAIATRYGLKEEMKNAYEHISALYAQQNDYREAYINLLSYQHLHNDLLSEKGVIAGIEALFIKQKQENRILLLEREQEKQKAQTIKLSALLFIVIIVTVLGFFIYKISQESKIALNLARLEKERFKAVIEAQEKERKRIAGDLHDSVGQMLSLSKLHLSEIIDSSGNLDLLHGQLIERSVQIIDEACQEVRNISHNLMPGPLIRLGLNSAIKDLVRQINASRRMLVTYSSNFETDRLDESVEISIYRIIQEIFNNIFKHSDATEVDMVLNRQNRNRVKLIVRDNGKGFDTEKIKSSSGIGWKNIQSRLLMTNGIMKVDSTPDQGTVISIDVFFIV